MSHQVGIEAAADELVKAQDDPSEFSVAQRVIKAYLDASGMAMVSKGDPKMENAGWQVMKMFYKDKASKDVSDEILQQAISAAPHHFQTPEESREKR